MANPRKSKKDTSKTSSWAVVRTILTFNHHHQQHKIITKQEEQPLHPNKQHPPSNKQHTSSVPEGQPSTKHKKMRCSGSLCSNTKVVVIHNTFTSLSPETHKRGSRKSPRNEPVVVCNGSALTSTMSSSSLLSSSSASSNSRSSRGMPFRRLSGCYECRTVVDPASGLSRDLSSCSSIRSTLCCCPNCGEVFMKSETLDLHQVVRHAELGPEDTSKSVVQIIFQSSWLKKQSPTCKIVRILKVHNPPRTITGFEQHRDSIKSRAASKKRNPRCLADGNELLRFYCASLGCPLGLNGSTNLCTTGPRHFPCGVCNIIRNGFESRNKGVLTMSTSGRAHDNAGWGGDDERAMLVCRVIAGRVKREGDEGMGTEDRDYDSIAKAGEGGGLGSSNMMEELIVLNPKAILPCFVVIYKLI